MHRFHSVIELFFFKRANKNEELSKNRMKGWKLNRSISRNSIKNIFFHPDRISEMASNEITIFVVIVINWAYKADATSSTEDRGYLGPLNSVDGLYSHYCYNYLFTRFICEIFAIYKSLCLGIHQMKTESCVLLYHPQIHWVQSMQDSPQNCWRNWADLIFPPVNTRFF